MLSSMGNKKKNAEKKRREVAAPEEDPSTTQEQSQRAKFALVAPEAQTQAQDEPLDVAANDDEKVDKADDDQDGFDTSVSLEDAMNDWSGTGRGSHVDFRADEAVPLEKLRSLGRGAVGDVFETKSRGYRLALKRIAFRQKILPKDMKEINVLKKLRHTHIVKLLGTYTHRQNLGLLLHPVAVCDLRTFFEDIEAYWTGDADHSQKARLTTLGYSETLRPPYRASPVYSQIGCLISALVYLHSQKIRHKDLKPSNVLLSPRRLYVSDFGSATDFASLANSATDNGGGTHRYLAPEMAEWKPSGRAADIFSLGCLILEIVVIHSDGTLKRLRADRSRNNHAYYANLDRIDTWLPMQDNLSSRRYHLFREIRAMLSVEPEQRPKAHELLYRISLCDKMMEHTKNSIFGDCCRMGYVTASHHEETLLSLGLELKASKKRVLILEGEADRLREDLVESYNDHHALKVEKRQTELRQIEIVQAVKELERLNLVQDDEIIRLRAEAAIMKKILMGTEIDPTLRDQFSQDTSQTHRTPPISPYAFEPSQSAFARQKLAAVHYSDGDHRQSGPLSNPYSQPPPGQNIFSAPSQLCEPPASATLQSPAPANIYHLAHISSIVKTASPIPSPSASEPLKQKAPYVRIMNADGQVFSFNRPKATDSLAPGEPATVSYRDKDQFGSSTSLRAVADPYVLATPAMSAGEKNSKTLKNFQNWFYRQEENDWKPREEADRA